MQQRPDAGTAPAAVTSAHSSPPPPPAAGTTSIEPPINTAENPFAGSYRLTGGPSRTPSHRSDAGRRYRDPHDRHTLRTQSTPGRSRRGLPMPSGTRTPQRPPLRPPLSNVVNTTTPLPPAAPAPTARALRASNSVADANGQEAVLSAVPKAARFAPSETSSKHDGTLSGRFKDLMHNLAEQMSMTPLSSSLTGTTESGITPSDAEAGTARPSSTDGMLPAEKDYRDHGDHHRGDRSWRAEGSAVSTLPSFSTLDLGSGNGRKDRQRRRKRRSTSTATEEDPPGPMSYVVVDNDFEAFIPDQDHADEKHLAESSDDHHSVADCEINSAYTSYLNSDSSSRRRMKRPWTIGRVVDLWKYHIWLPTCHFVDSSFQDPNAEKAFKKEEWYANKHAALMAAFFLVVQWVVTLAVQEGLDLWREYAYLGICGFWTLPLPFLVAFNGPRRFKWIYYLWVAGACWCWGWVLTVEMYNCGFYAAVNTCGTRNFLHLLAALFANASFAVISLGQNRGVHMLLATAWFVAAAALFFSQPKTPVSMWRNFIVFELYHLFLSAMSFFRERSDRQLFSLRVQLKDQYRAVQNAQVQERRAEDSKKRFMSYIFHEVRVPLNTARLALANLDGEGAFHGMNLDQKELIIGLDGSLRMMEKVLNDVLSFNRMESGNLIQARKPFNIHKAVHYVALSHRATAELSGLDLELQLDPRIDDIGGTVIGDEMRFKQVCSNLVSNAFKFTPAGGVKLVTKLLLPGMPEPEPERRMYGSVDVISPGTTVVNCTPGTVATLTIDDKEKSDGETPLDENGTTVALNSPASDPPSAKSATSAIKRVSVDERARLSFDFANPERPMIELGKLPHRNSDSAAIAPTAMRHRSMPPSAANPFSPAAEDPAPPRKALIRVEVHDTGVGISLSDVRDNRLFSPYVQTEIGRRQGGKGSGLGLALVMQIVKLSRGRLGVDSELGKGSVFWFEIPYALSPRPARPSSIPQWVTPETRRGSEPSPRGSISIANGALSRSRRESASAPPGGQNLQQPLFNLLPFSSPMISQGSAPPSEASPRSVLPPLPSDGDRSTPEIADISMESVEPHMEQGEPVWEPESLRTRTASVLPSPAVPVLDLTRDNLSALPEGMLSVSPTSMSPLSPSSERPPPQHRSLLGRTPSLVPYQVPRTTQTGVLATSKAPPVIPGSPTPGVSILPQYPSPGSDASPGIELPTSPLSGPLAAEGSGGGLGLGLGITPAPPVPVPSPTPEEPLHVLVVDDDALTRKLMSRMLKRLGHTVTQAENGKVALNTILDNLAHSPFDIVFLDNQMPIMSGVEVARALRVRKVDTYVVGCTGNALREDQDEYLTAGADDIIPKPVSQNAIVKRLEEAKRRRARRVAE